MAHVSDFKKNSLAIVLDLINADNSTAFQENQLTFGTPTVVDGKVTNLKAQAANGSGYSGFVDLTYNRILLSEVPTLGAEVKEADVTSLNDVLAFVNEQYGINLSADDVTINGAELATNGDDSIEGTFDQVVDYVFSSKAASLVWLGDVTVQLTPERQDLAALLLNTNPDGLYPPDAIDYPEAFMHLDEEGFTRTREDGSVRIFAGIPVA